MVASILEVVAVVCSIGGVLVGAAFMAQVRVTATGAKAHPHVAVGNAVILAAILLGGLSWCVARAIGLFATDVAARQGVDITLPTPSKLPEFLRRHDTHIS